MSKLLKLLGKITTIFLEWFLVVFILFAFLVRTSPVQTYLAQRATTYFSKELKTKVDIKRVSIVFFNRLVLDGVNIEDRHGGKVAYMKSLFVTLKGINQIKHEIRLKQLKVENGVFHFNQSKRNGKFNFDFIIDYFSSTDKSNSTPYTFKVDQIALKGMDLKYDDFRIKQKTDEIDYDHIHLKKFYLFADHFSLHNGTIKAAVNQLSLRERCGLRIKRFSGYVKVNNTGIRVKELRARINRSEAYLPKFQMLYSKWSDFLEFDDKVRFDAIVENSNVNMKDIRFFASELEGMDQICRAKAVVSHPLKNMTIDQLHLEFGENSLLEGKVILPDFRNLKRLEYNEFFSYAKITTNDIEHFNFPLISEIAPIELNTYIEKFKYFECNDLKITGTNQNSNVFANKIRTNIGEFELQTGVNVKHNLKKDNYRFKSIDSLGRNVKIDSLDLGKMFDFDLFGKLSGKVDIDGSFDFDGNFAFKNITGKINRFFVNKYGFKSINLEKFQYEDEEIITKFKSEDQFALLDFDGLISLKNDYNFNFSTKIDQLDLFQTNISIKPQTKLSGEFDVDLSGLSLNTLRGDFKGHEISLTKFDKIIDVKHLVAELDRFKNKDELKIKSSLFDLNIEGDFDFNSLISQVNNGINAVFPTLVSKRNILKKDRVSNLEYSLRVNDANSLFEMYIPSLRISKGTKIKGQINEELLELNINSSNFEFKGFKFKDLKVNNYLVDGLLETEIESSNFILGDTIRLSQFDFYAKGKDNLLNTNLQWNSGKEESVIAMNFSMQNKSRVLLEMLPSYFHLNKNRWDLYKTANIIIDKKYVRFENLELKHKDELIMLDGVLSNNSSEYANLVVSNFELENISSAFGLPKKIKGKFNADIQLSNPFVKLEASGDALINNLVVNKEKVGTIDLSGSWLPNVEAFQLKGNVIYRDNPSFNFYGNYYPFKSENDLDFDLQFNGTDIQIANAFVDDEILNDIQGNLFGEMRLRGDLFSPEMVGELDLKAGRAKVEMLGVYFGFEGKVISDKEGFYVNSMPVRDQEGKVGSLVATIYHSRYKNWNYDINVDFTEDITSVPGMRIPINRYLILNTNYREGDIYYGKAYGKGTLNINGTESNVSITTDIETEEGTSVNFPMYGQSTIQEDKFISFKKKGEDIKSSDKKMDFTGVDFNLNLKVNSSSKMRLIFDEKLGDEITAFGEGDLKIKIDQNNDVQMNGIYKIKNDAGQKSTYNFVLGPIKQGFIIEDNGTITWNGNPYVANLDLTTYYNVYTSLNEIVPVTSVSSSQNFQDIKCNLKLSESIEKPKLNFELELAKSGTGVTDDARAALDRINKTPEELNKQFVSLLLYKKFQPLLSSNNTVGSNAVADLVANQLNSLLSDLSKDYKFNVMYNSSALTTDASQVNNNLNKLAMGVTKDFFDGKLLINGTFGRTYTTNQSMLIGNVSIEYKLNEDGTIRVIAFNETNDFNVSAQLSNNRTTQGGGINIQEEFTSLNEFDLFQKMMNIFRSDNRKRIIKRNKKGRVPVVKPNASLDPENQQASF